jgi:hypothetical protein
MAKTRQDLGAQIVTGVTVASAGPLWVFGSTLVSESRSDFEAVVVATFLISAALNFILAFFESDPSSGLGVLKRISFAAAAASSLIIALYLLYIEAYVEPILLLILLIVLVNLAFCARRVVSPSRPSSDSA